jgi:dipeptidyl aminopeptidase/acylaminoacyl peptidase
MPGRKGGVRLTPDGRDILFQVDPEGREISDLYRAPVTGQGRPENLTATDKVDETSPLAAPDGKQIVFSSRNADEPSSDLVLMDLATRAARRLTHEAVQGLQWTAVAFTRDGRTLIANRYDFSLAFGEAYRIDLATGRSERLTPEGLYGSASAVTPDGRYVAITLETAEGVRQAALVDTSTGERRLIDKSPWEQRTSGFSPDGRRLLFLTDDDGRNVVSTYDLASRKTKQLPLPAGNNGQGGYLITAPSFSPDGRQVLFQHGSGAIPQDYWSYDLATRKAERLTHLGRLDGWKLPPTQVVHYPSYDGTVISAVLWMPYNLKRDGKAPAVLLAHGGPTGQQMDSFDRTAVGLASRGYIVLSPNFRGSTGYGQAFLNANRLDLGGGDLKDVVAGAEFLEKTGYVDARRIGITGGSYGGYMTLIALSKTPDVFAAGVDMFGIVNWWSMWERGSPTNRRYQEGLVGTPEKNPQVYKASSPLTYLDQLKAPLLVLQGENDPLVPPHESRQVVEFLQKAQRTVDAHFYAGEGHGFVKPENQMDALRRTIDWFDRYLK